MTRIELGRKVIWGLPGLGLAALVAASIALGVASVELWLTSLTSTLTGKLSAFTAFMLVGPYYIFATRSNDPFWPIRKRLWTQGNIWLAANDKEDELEPFVWDARTLPVGTDVSDQIDH